MHEILQVYKIDRFIWRYWINCARYTR